MARAVRQHRLSFPVGLDNDFAAWQAYGNHYWPSQHLIDACGRVRYRHVGEGRHRQTEATARALLADVGGLEPNRAVGGQTGIPSPR